MTPLEDGNYYLPAHQIPYIGKKFAEKNGKTVAEYWRKHWAEPIGRLQAKLLIRYGMKVRAVNPQNFLIQLDQEFKPTCVMVWRDLAESHLIRNVANEIGLQKLVEQDDLHGSWGVDDYANVDDFYIAWRFDDVMPTLLFLTLPVVAAPFEGIGDFHAEQLFYKMNEGSILVDYTSKTCTSSLFDGQPKGNYKLFKPNSFINAIRS